jgi:hypothetical protein
MQTQKPDSISLVAIVATVAVVATPLTPPSLSAQPRLDASLAVGAGVATDARGTRSGAVSVTPGVAVAPDARLRFGLSGTATRFAAAAHALSGTAAVDARQALGTRAAIAISASAARTVTSYDARYDALSALPSLEARLVARRNASLTAYVGASAAAGVTEYRVVTPATSGSAGGSSNRPSLPIVGDGGGSPGASPQVSTVRVTRSAHGVSDGAVAAFGTATDAVTLAYRESRLRIADARYTDRTASAARVSGPVTVHASVGMRHAESERSTFGSVGALLDVGHGVAAQAVAGRYPSDPVAGTLGGRFASVGFVLRAARVARVAPGATPASARPTVTIPGAPPVPDGAARLVLRAPDARVVEVAGDWTNWRPVAATRGADGRWWLDVRLPRGDYRYAFRVDGGRWRVPDDAPSVDDGFSGRSAILVVR